MSLLELQSLRSFKSLLVVDISLDSLGLVFVARVSRGWVNETNQSVKSKTFLIIVEQICTQTSESCNVYIVSLPCVCFRLLRSCYIKYRSMVEFMFSLKRIVYIKQFNKGLNKRNR